MRQPPRLSYYSYDSLKNPWLSGGGALRDFEILRRQRDSWKDIVVYTGSYPGFTAETREGIRFQSLGFGKSYALSRLSFTVIANLKLLFDRSEVIGNSITPYAPLLTGLLRRGRLFLVAHHYIGRKSLEKFGIVGAVLWFCEWLMFRFCKNIIVSNGSLAARARGMNPSLRLLQSQNGFDAVLLESVPEEASPAFILFLGRFDIYMKGLDLLLQAFGKIRPELRAPIKLVLAGIAAPKALAAVEKLVPPGLSLQVELAPNISEETKRSYLRRCLFFCSPSRFEGWGIAALEANAAGKPVLVTDTDGFRDSIKADYSGLMIPIGDEAALVRGLEKLLEEPQLRLQMGQNARVWASRFTWKEIAAKEREWIRSTLGR